MFKFFTRWKLLGWLGAFQSLQFLAGLEAHGFPRRNAHFFAGTRISSNSGFPRLHAEDSKAAQFDALTAAQRGLQRFENRLHRLFGLGAADVGFCHHGVYDVQLDQTSLPHSVGRCYWVRRGLSRRDRLNYTDVLL